MCLVVQAKCYGRETGLGTTSSNFFTGFAKFGGMAKVI